jgi:hypothetical protein
VKKIIVSEFVTLDGVMVPLGASSAVRAVGGLSSS